MNAHQRRLKRRRRQRAEHAFARALGTALMPPSRDWWSLDLAAPRSDVTVVAEFQGRHLVATREVR